MTKKELLAEAIRRYPIGTVFSPAHVNVDKKYTMKTHVIQNCSEWEVTFNSGGTEMTEYSYNVYWHGKWADIISLPSSWTPKPGDWVYVTGDYEKGDNLGTRILKGTVFKIEDVQERHPDLDNPFTHWVYGSLTHWPHKMTIGWGSKSLRLATNAEIGPTVGDTCTPFKYNVGDTVEFTKNGLWGCEAVDGSFNVSSPSIFLGSQKITKRICRDGVNWYCSACHSGQTHYHSESALAPIASGPINSSFTLPLGTNGLSSGTTSVLTTAGGQPTWADSSIIIPQKKSDKTELSYDTPVKITKLKTKHKLSLL